MPRVDQAHQGLCAGVQVSAAAAQVFRIPEQRGCAGLAEGFRLHSRHDGKWRCLRCHEAHLKIVDSSVLFWGRAVREGVHRADRT